MMLETNALADRFARLHPSTQSRLADYLMVAETSELDEGRRRRWLEATERAARMQCRALADPDA